MTTYPFQREKYRKILTIDSYKAAFGNGSNFTVNVNMPPINSFNSVCVLTASIDKMFYMLSTNEEPVILGQPGPTNTTFYLPPGNYTSAQYATDLPAILNTASQTGQTFTVTYNNKLNTFTIAANNNTAFSLDFTNARLSAQYLGFQQQKYTSTSVSSIQIITSAIPSNLQRYQSLLIKSDMGINGIFGDDISTLATIFPGSVGTDAVILYKAVDAISSSVTIKDRNTNQYNFTIVDAYNNQTIDMNNGNCRLTICLSQEKI